MVLSIRMESGIFASLLSSSMSRASLLIQLLYFQLQVWVSSVYCHVLDLVGHECLVVSVHCPHAQYIVDHQCLVDLLYCLALIV